MNFKTEFIQICFRCSADFIQPSFHLFCDVVISWSVSINRALLSLFFDLHFGCTCLYDLRPRAEDSTVEVQVWVLSCFPVVADPSTVEQWRVPFPLAKRVAKLVSPLSFTCQSRSNSLNAYFSDLCLEGQNLSSHFAFSRACSVIFLFTICKWQDDFEKLYIMLYDCFSSRDLVPLLIVY